MSTTTKFGLCATVLGFFVALCLAGLAYVLNFNHITYNLDTLYTILGPTSLILMATEHATAGTQVFIVMVFALQNAIIYGLLGLVVGKMWGSFHNDRSD